MLSAELDARLHEWLEREADAGRTPRPGLEGAAVITVTARAVGALERVCALWGLRSQAVPCAAAGWVVMRVDGPALPVQGLAGVVARMRSARDQTKQR